MTKKQSVKYIDAFVLVVPKSKVVAYRKMAKDAGKIWVKYGALGYKECMGDDLNPDMQGYPFLAFPQMTNLKPTETVWFSYIEYQSKAHRNAVNKKVMKEMEVAHKDEADHMKNIPFDLARMAFGGFKVEVSS